MKKFFLWRWNVSSADIGGTVVISVQMQVSNIYIKVKVKVKVVPSPLKQQGSTAVLIFGLWAHCLQEH